MKYLLILSLLILGCNKDKLVEGNKVIYTIKCDSCQATFNTRNGVKTVDVIGFYQLGEINSLPVINLTLVGSDDTSSSIKVNGNYIHKAIGDGSFKIQVR